MRALAVERGWNWKLVEPGTFETRLPSRTIPEQLRDVMSGSRSTFRTPPGKWHEHKLERLYAGEIYPTTDAFFVEIPNALVHIASGAVFTEDHVLLMESAPDAGLPDSDHTIGAALGKAPRLAGVFMTPISKWSWNYAHWLFDSLPRFGVLGKIQGSMRVLLQAKPPAFQRESLEMLGFSSDHLVPVSESVVQVDRLVLVVSSGRCGIPNAKALAAVRDRLLPATPGSGSDGGLLYVPRRSPSRSTSKRRIVNEGEVEAALKEYGFRTVEPEYLHFAEQTRIFSTARVIVGPHGAGSYNHIFAPCGAPLVELINPFLWDHTAVRLTSQLGQHHWHLFGTNRNKANDFSIDLERLKKLLASLLGGETNHRLACENTF